MVLKKFGSFVLIVTIVAALMVPTTAFAGAWRITSLDWQPYSGSDMRDQGKSIAILKDVLARNGIELIVEFYPWRRAQYLARQPKYLGYFPAWPEEVAEGFVASQPVDWSYIGVLAPTGSNLTWENIDTLYKNHKVATIVTYAYPREIEDAMKRFPGNVITSPNETLCAKMLVGKRAEAAITDPNVMLYSAKQVGITNIEILKKDLRKKALVIALRNDDANRERIEFLNKILTEN
ncbi:MAG: amino acid ABC transporter substrate-binding protein [Desulfobacteraceae bacterium]|nr:amino acid ABC transporter substrate-binding protein [Desulfobacteraceae bacterium]